MDKENVKKKRQTDFLHGPIFSSILLFAIPVLFSNIFQQLYNTVDTVIIGYTLGEASLAAIGSATPVYDLLVGFAVGFGNGLSIVVGRCFGAGDQQQLKRSVAASLVLGAGLSVVIAVLTQLILNPLLVLLNTPEETFAQTYSYISIITMFTIVMFAYNLCSFILRAVGNSTAPLAFLIFSSVLNVVLDLFFIMQLGLGVKGAAIATVLAQAVSVVLCVIYIVRKVQLLVPAREHFVRDGHLYIELATQGLSMGFMSSIVSAGSVILQSGINGLGYLYMAAHTASRKLFMFFYQPFVSMMMAINSFVAQNYGANQPMRIKKAMKYGYIFNAFMAAAITAILLPGAPLLVRLISGSTETIVIENATLYLRVLGPFYFVLGTLLYTRVALQSIGKKLLPIVSSVMELVGKILFTIFLIPAFGYTAVVFCEPVIWCCMAAELLIVFWHTPYIRNASDAQMVPPPTTVSPS